MIKIELLDFKDGLATFGTKIQISDNVFKEEGTGYLYCKNSILGNVGVQKYYGKEIGLIDDKADQVIEMVRDSIDVFDENSMSTYTGKPITLLHPKGKVNSKNYKKFIVGSLKDAVKNADNIEGDIVIYDEYTIDKVLKGEIKDLSLGYSAKVVEMADGRYKQENIVINHLAIVEDGRAENAQIVDNKTVKDENVLEPKDFTDKIHVTESTNTSLRVNTYDDETQEETTKEFTTYESKHTHYEKAKQLMIDSKNKKIKEKDMDNKDFKYYMTELKDLSTYPKTEFRDGAHKALADECLETLGVKLPTFEEMKVSAVANSVGFKDTKEEKEEKEETKVLKVFAKDENRFFEKLYRSMDNVDTARKYANMSYHDVCDAITEGRML